MKKGLGVTSTRTSSLAAMRPENLVAPTCDELHLSSSGNISFSDLLVDGMCKKGVA